MIDIVQDYNNTDWLDCCSSHDVALFSHLQTWSRILASSYDLPAYFLLARNTDAVSKITGILPLLLFAPPHAPKRLISLPYTDAAGILADSEEIQGELLEAALDLAVSMDAIHLELRQYDRLAPSRYAHRWIHTEHAYKVGLKRALPESQSHLWESLPAKVRNQIRKARNEGCFGLIGDGELLSDFYAVFSENMRDLGSPVHDFELFKKALAQDELYARCIVIYYRNQPAAGAIVFAYGGTLFNPWASSLRRFRPACPNMLLYWAMLDLAMQSGCQWFDFGRSSPGASTCRFKMQWGAKIEPLFWHVFSQEPHNWHPADESLVDEEWKNLDLDVSLKKGPAVRRWISL